MTDNQFELLLEALNRIAAALEQSNLREMYPPVWVTTAPAPPAAYPTVPSGYTCQRCFQWVAPGVAHACNNFSAS